MRIGAFHITESEGTGISAPLSRDVNLLGSLLGKVIRSQAGEEIFELVESLRALCKNAYQAGQETLRDQAAEKIRALSIAEITALLRSYTAFFHLVNQAEKKEIIRINRERERNEKAPRKESIREAIHHLQQSGFEVDRSMNLIRRLDIQPTLTAHPTEARRRTILEKQQRISSLLADLDRADLTRAEEESIAAEIYQQILLLFVTDEVLAERPTVENEVENALYFLSTSIWNTVPQIYHDIRNSFKEFYQTNSILLNTDWEKEKGFLRYCSWMGGDRDGNPYVTPAVTRWTLKLHRDAAIALYREQLESLQRELSISSNQTKVSIELAQSIEKEAEEFGELLQSERNYRLEPFRTKIRYMIEKLNRNAAGEESYSAEDFLHDLLLIRRSLQVSKLSDVADNGTLLGLIFRARAFGFRMAALDIRQHSEVHETAAAELLRVAGIEKNYSSLSESDRVKLLARELTNVRPLIPRMAPLSEITQSTLEVFELVRLQLARDRDSIGSYIVSMTHGVSDLLEVLLLAKEAGLLRIIENENESRIESDLDIVPLFETIDDLNGASVLMDRLFADSFYRRHLAARGLFQEIMLGYSDSSKDGGYWMSTWALRNAQEKLAEVCVRHGIAFRFFHGRGGTIGRGGGRANQAILTMPASSNNGRIRVTEQGEVISFRYASVPIAHRHLEQIVHAIILSLVNSPEKSEAIPSVWQEIMEELAKKSMRAYRAFITHSDLWEWYTEVTPVEQISRLPIASRPVSRGSMQEVNFEKIRAIPWVFAWIQTRYNIPGWYGVGTAFDEVIQQNGVEGMQEMYRKWGFFRAAVDNVQLEMARAHLVIAQYYSRLSNYSFHQQVKREFDLARAAILKITGNSELLENYPVIRKSILLRNPYTDVLNLIQVELLRRWRETAAEELRPALFLSINGIAAAMQSTG